MSNPANLKEICEKLNQNLIDQTSAKECDNLEYFVYHENYVSNYIVYMGNVLINSENDDLYDDEKRDFDSVDLNLLMLTGEQKVLQQINSELKKIETNVKLASKIVSEEIYFKS